MRKSSSLVRDSLMDSLFNPVDMCCQAGVCCLNNKSEVCCCIHSFKNSQLGYDGAKITLIGLGENWG